MKIITDCFDLHHIEQYAKCGIDRLIVSLPFVSLREVKTYTYDEVKKKIPVLHEKNMEIAVNMLNFVLEESIEKFKEALVFCKEEKVDVIYFSDMGVYQMAKELKIEHKLVYQPTTLITNSMDANNYLDLGIQSVVLSREITFDDMKKILSKCKKCEVSVFGRNVMMHSRRKLLSSYFEFVGKEDVSNSSHLYLMEENRNEKMPIFQDANGTHILSGSTFCFFKELNELQNSDFKFDGFGLNEEMICQSILDAHKILSNEIDGKEMFEDYQNTYTELNVSDGFMYKKTSLVKEACNG